MDVKRPAIFLFDLCETTQARFLWKHAWFTRGNSIKSKLLEKGIPVIKDDTTDNPVAIPSKKVHPTSYTIIRKIFSEAVDDTEAVLHKLSYEASNTEILTISQKLSDNRVGIYEDTNSRDIWFVGRSKSVHDTIKCFDDQLEAMRTSKHGSSTDNNSSDGGSGRTDFENSFEHIRKPVQVQLTHEQQAMLWFNDLLDLKCLKGKPANLTINRFEVNISVPDNQTKKTLEEDIRRELSTCKQKVGGEKLQSFSSSKYNFLKRDEVHSYCKKQLNALGYRLDCVWFHGDSNKVTVYTDSKFTIGPKCTLLQGLVVEESVGVPQCYFRTEKGQQQLKKIEEKQKGKLSVILNKSQNTVYVLYTRDIPTPIVQINRLFATKTVSIFSHPIIFEMMFEKQKRNLEATHNVDIQTNVTSAGYCLVVKGDPSEVVAVSSKLSKLKENIVSEVKSYLTEECIDTINSKLGEIDKNSCCHVSLLPDAVKAKTKASDQQPTDVRDQIQCHSLKMMIGSYLVVYKCDLQKYLWLHKDSFVVCVVPIDDFSSQPKTDILPREDRGSIEVTIRLPNWAGNTNKERERLTDLLMGIFGFVTSHRDKNMSISFDLLEVNKVGWPKKKYLKYILCAVEKFQLQRELHFFDYPENSFEDTSSIINMWCTGERRKHFPKLQINVVKGKLANMQCDALVNSTSGHLLLSRGVVSNTLLTGAGVEMQHECTRYLQGRPSINYSEVVVTKGYNLLCKHVFHGTLPGYQLDANNDFEKFIENCLAKAVELKLSTIAFPALGTGQLAYPQHIAAAKMFKVVEQFSMFHHLGNLFEVNFVIYPNDKDVVQAFESEGNNRKDQGMPWNESIITSPELTSFTVLVIGDDKSAIKDSIKSIDDSLRQKQQIQNKNILPGGKNSEIDLKSNVTEPDEQVIDNRDENPTNCTASNKMQLSELAHDKTRYTEEQGLSSDNTFLPEDLYPSPPPMASQNEASHVAVEILTNENQGSYQALVHTASKYDITEDQIVWNSSTPMKARLKFNKEADAEKFKRDMLCEKQYKVQRCSKDAVVNIRAKLNSSMRKYLEGKESRIQLTKQSGVSIYEDENEIILTGDLTEISSAREILLSWKCHRHPNQDRNLDITNPSLRQSISPESRKSKELSANHNSDGIIISDTSTPGLRKVHEVDGKLKMEIVSKRDDKSSEYNVKNYEDIGKDESVSGPSVHTNLNTREIYFKNASYRAGQDEPLPQMESKFDQTIHEATSPPTGEEDGYASAQNSGDGDKYEYHTRIDDGKNGGNNYPMTQNIALQETNVLDNHPQSTTGNKSQHQDFKPNIQTIEESLVMDATEGVKVFVFKADICHLDNVDCIVNSSNSEMKHTGGLSLVISREAGQIMEDECRTFITQFKSLNPGNVCTTTAGQLSHYKRILHVNGPSMKHDLKTDEFADDLALAVRHCLERANKELMKSCALPAISSGYGGIPKEVCFNAYPKGVTSFLKKVGKKSVLKVIYFVDRDQDKVDCIEGAFLNAVIETPVKKWKEKWKKLPEKTKKLFRSHSRDESLTDECLESHFDNRIAVVSCGGTLLNSLKHQHVETLTKTMGYGEWKKSETGIVISENLAFQAKGQTVQLCLKRGGKLFGKNYDSLKTIPKKKIGSTFESFAGDLEFRHAIFIILPSLGQNAYQKKSDDQTFFFETIGKCCINILVAADKLGIKHLSMPVLCQDFYTCSEDWFLKRFIHQMITAIKVFAKGRNDKDFMIIHIVTNGNDKVFQLLGKEMS